MLSCATCKAKYNVGKSASAFIGIHTSISLKVCLRLFLMLFMNPVRQDEFFNARILTQWEGGNKQGWVFLPRSNGICG
jgi:hypothetical protein